MYTQAMASAGLHVCFDAQITGGTGADGMTLMLLDASAGNGALGAGGSGLGFGGLPGMAVALDTYLGTGDPSDNFVGVADTGTVDGLHYLGTNTAIRMLEGSGTIPVEVRVVNGRLQVTLDGTLVLDVASGTLPSQVRLGFSAATGGLNNRHLVSNVRVDVPTTTTPGQLVVQPTSIGFGSVAVGSSATANVVLSNTGGSSLSLSSVTLPTSPFSAVAPTIGAGTVIPAGGSVTQVVRFSPSATGPATGSLSVTPNTGQGPITVSLSGSGTSPPPCTSELPAVTDATWQRNGVSHRLGQRRPAHRRGEQPDGIGDVHAGHGQRRPARLLRCPDHGRVRRRWHDADAGGCLGR